MDIPKISIGSKAVGSSITIYNPAYGMGSLSGPDRDYYDIYERAFRTDSIINRAINYICLTMLSSIGNYVHEDPTIQAFVRENLERAEGNMHEWMSALIISALIYGRGNSELVWDIKDGKVWLKDLVNYHPRSIYLVTDTAGKLTDGKRNAYHPTFKKTGVWQELPPELVKFGRPGRDKWLNYIRIPLRKMVVVTHNKRFGNYDGESALAPIWKDHQRRLKTKDDLMVTTERYGSPQIAAIVPNALTSNIITDPITGLQRPETAAEAAARNLENMSIATALVFEEPSGMPGEKVRIQPINTGNNFGDSFLATIHALSHEILLGLGVPPLLFLEQSNGLGSGNITATQADSYKQTLVALYKEFIEPFTEQAIGTLIKYNFGEDVGSAGRFEFNPFDIAATEILSTVIDTAIDCGIVDTSVEEDLQLCRARLGFPSIGEDSIDSRLEANKALMENRRHPDQPKIEGQKEMATIQGQNQIKIVKEQTKAQKELEALKGKTQLKIARQGLFKGKQKK